MMRRKQKLRKTDGKTIAERNGQKISIKNLKKMEPKKEW